MLWWRTSVIPFRWICGLAFWIAACGTGSGAPVLQSGSNVVQQAERSQGSRCVEDTGVVRISPDSIGPLPVTATLARLRALCPAARDTVEYGDESANPAVFFPFWHLNVIAFQAGSSLRPERQAEGWVVGGTNGVLPEGVPLTARWKDVRTAYGNAMGETESGVTVMFCKWPTFFFKIDARIEPGTQLEDFSVIPDNAGILYVEITRGPEPGWQCR